MGIKKDDLREFISGKSKQRKDAILEQARAAIRAEIGPVVSATFSALPYIEHQAQSLYDNLLALKTEHKRFDYWGFNEVMSDLNKKIVGLLNRTIRDEINKIVGVLIIGHTDGWMPELNEVVEQLRLRLDKDAKEYRALAKLGEEINTIIDSSRNGDQAYKKLQELGVDLSGFEAAPANLPAVVKLSVDPCVLNGNCN